MSWWNLGGVLNIGGIESLSLLQNNLIYISHKLFNIYLCQQNLIAINEVENSITSYNYIHFYFAIGTSNINGDIGT